MPISKHSFVTSTSFRLAGDTFPIMNIREASE